MKQTWSIINNFCKINNKEVNITLKINEAIITDTQVIVDKFNIFFSKIGDQVISELENNNNVNVSYKQYLTNPTDARFQFEEVSVDTTITLPTRLSDNSSLIDNVFTSNLSNALSAYILSVHISDHQPVILYTDDDLPHKKLKYITTCIETNSEETKRHFCSSFKSKNYGSTG